MFVEHLKNIETKILNGTIILPNLEYIKKFITGDNGSVFSDNTYFGIKMFIKKDEYLYFVLDVSIPFDENISYKEYIKNPKIDDCLNLKSILDILFKLKCNLYEKSFIPITMINRLVSLSNVPSKKILTIFTKENLN